MTVSSAPREECVISSHSHWAPSTRGRPRLAGLKKHKRQPVNSTDRLGVRAQQFWLCVLALQQSQVEWEETVGKQPPPRSPTTAVHNTPAVAATTCCNQWRRDARVLGSLLLVRWGLWGPSLLVHWCHPRCFESSSFLWQLGRFLFGMPAWGPSRPLRQMAGSRVAALWYDPLLSGGRRPRTHSSRREVVSGPAHTGGCPPHGFWATCNGSQDAATSGCQPGVRVVPFFVWSVLGSPPFSSLTVSLFTQVVPCGPWGNSSTAWVDDRTSCWAGVRDDSASAELPR